ncbi:bifunctional diaminohydroxyphosphoribosylaminopyrimidine deaminase/5-amino-6-(5-phosphoribosylamino)uracil reductase RibD [Solitalea lacus]|uniref:bifunctional diaminohydroxyphosphoribosylaminopyrimidine deaminase/5-amino-6-(5-phosphoribosylamino)uracil reductase RibD n=1 Tax=Solitalea lacus TaxID=2911172 RepID=UPI001EDA4C48|nr:bifunctional diaminohydroxyphosphoribosylaminopyrimidine deaminase/5-amino-6-(5-phosphoribosylamino)uracil reductase RibD [Solitalea lacus]UKJ06018.1 bifunctional diaminohydroxyphosphoribosylaminopyrimidine deaminase/5-amino-6-(5-phosphoribosylamino)uracil reductase RibD [Solitalea lacus]
MNEHQLYIKRCIELAQTGQGNVSPNPMVGSVIVCDGKIIGEGFHEKFGQAHAEVNAINAVLKQYSNASELLKQSTIYVSLEPCSHYGKTPPCADLIVKHQIPRVVVGCIDPFEKVSGKGIEKLKSHGIEVISGILEKDCLSLNKRFITSQKQKRPYIILKWAQTSNGYFAPKDGSQFWITGKRAMELVHKWRSEEDAILIGSRTALIDDPQLTVREWIGRNPIRVVVDKNLKLPSTLKLFDKSAKTIVYNEQKTKVFDNIYYNQLEFNEYLPQFMMYQLYLQDIQSVIIEGGANLLNQFIKYNLWDEARIFTGDKVLTDGIVAPILSGKLISKVNVGNDELRIIFNESTQS